MERCASQDGNSPIAADLGPGVAHREASGNADATFGAVPILVPCPEGGSTHEDRVLTSRVTELQPGDAVRTLRPVRPISLCP
jgi:hypothetical protein